MLGVTPAGVVLALLVTLAAPLASAQAAHPLHVAQPEAAPAEALLAVEIPTGGQVKYELGGDGLLYADRFMSMAVAYPANYGSLPSTLGGDGDPLDALVLTRVPLQPGVLMRMRPVGVLRMRDGGEDDEKLIGVPVDAVDPTYSGISDLGDLPSAELQRIEGFFRVYKDLPSREDSPRIELGGWGDAAQARALLREAMERFASAGGH